MAIEQPNVEQAQGFSFAPDYIPETPKKMDKTATNVMSDLSSFAQSFLQKRSEENGSAFLEGYTDLVNDKVQEASWLDSDSYAQGVSYAKWGKSLEGATAGVQQINAKHVKRAVDNDPNDPFNMLDYDKDIQGLYSKFNDDLDKLGLQGTARELAQKQLLAAYTGARTGFQKELELVTTRNVYSTDASEANQLIMTWAANDFNPTAMVMTAENTKDSFLQRHNGVLKEKDTPQRADKHLGETIKGFLQNLNVSDPNSEKALKGFTEFLQTEEAPNILGSEYFNVQNALNTKRLEVQSSNGFKVAYSIDQLKLGIESGSVQPTRKDFFSLRQQNDIAKENGVLSESDWVSNNSKLTNLEIEYFKNEGTTADLMSNDPLRRRAAGGVDADSKATSEWLKKLTKVVPDMTALGQALVTQGVASINPHMVATGVKQWAPAIQTLANIPVEKMADAAYADTKNQWRQFTKLYKGYSTSQPLVAQAMLDALPDEVRGAVHDVILDGNQLGYSVEKDFSMIQGYMKQRKTAKEQGGYVGQFTGSKISDYTADNITSSPWRRLVNAWSLPWFDKGSGVEAQDWITEPNSEGAAMMAHQMNIAKSIATSSGYLGKLERSGTMINNMYELTDALIQGGFVVMTPTGPVAQDPKLSQQVQAMGAQAIQRATGELVQPDKAIISRALQSLKSEYWNRYKGALSTQGIDEEDIVMTGVNGVYNVTVYKNGANSPARGEDGTILRQLWGPQYVAERIAMLYKQDATKANAPFVLQDYYNGKQKVALTTTFRNALPHGMAEEVLPMLLKFEGNTGSRVHTPDPKNRPALQTIAMGVRIDGDYAKDPLRKAIKDAKTKQEQDIAMNNFLADYYKGFDKLVASAGLVPTAKATVENGRGAHLALAAAHYQSPLAGQEYAKILQVAKTDPTEAKAMMAKSVAFADLNKASNGKGLAHERYLFYIAGIDAARFAEVKRSNKQKMLAILPKVKDFGLPMR